MKLRFSLGVFCAGFAVVRSADAAVSDPLVTSWLTAPTGWYARLYQSDAAKAAGTAVTTWSRGQTNQTAPVYAGVMQVSYSTGWVYLRTSGLGYHVMGPWYLDAGHLQNFPNFPGNTATIYRFPRVPAAAVTHTLTNGGAIGYFVDGVAMFDNRDTFSYTHASSQDATPVNGLHGDGVWNRDAFVNEAVTFDPAYAHQAGSQYHYHANTPALRHELGDHVDFNANTRTYQESSAAVTAHSPIVGWAADGYPVYGPYGYASAMDAGSGVRRMISGYVKRDGTRGTINLASTGRTTLPAWAARAQSRSASLAPTVQGPAVNGTYTLGHYLEDYEYLGDVGGTLGTNFDLDEYNGRECVTPEFPQGTYAYFLSIEDDGTPKFPYILGRWFRGTPAGGPVTALSETVTEYVRGAPAAAIGVMAGAAVGGGVTLSWNSAEGATYKVESSADQAAWTTLAAAVTSGGATTSYGAPVAGYYRVTLVAIATYDTNGPVGTPVGTAGIVAYAPTVAPTITTAPVSATVAAGGEAMLAVEANGSGPLAYQWRKDGVDVAAATEATLTIPFAQTKDSGSYVVAVSNAGGAATSAAAALTVTPTPTAATARLMNLSTRAQTGGATGMPIVGFVLSGPGTRTMLVRAAGPALANSGVSAPLADPSLSLVREGTLLAANEDWSASDAATFTAAGAFLFTAGSKDAALVSALAGGVYSAPVGTGGGMGVALVEVYDAGGNAVGPALTNLSSRTFVGVGEQVAIAGFVIGGSGPMRLLLRAAGPALAAYGVGDALVDPRVTLYAGSAVVATNDDWSDNVDAATVATTATETGAFALASGSKDAAMIVSLPPGVYSMVVAGAGANTGTALAEIYVVP
ncbi:YHYH protein [Horticoccus luteus]|uniref:YHYH protein n=1 Tax=Horticoccus luteus TaxID=2862869 RepID=A0A8F9XH22_9BACT|nr:YHYH protein [Horticoccus luteus]QYM79852.1 YHYH protein [Horticoccus luteus]